MRGLLYLLAILVVALVVLLVAGRQRPKVHAGSDVERALREDFDRHVDQALAIATPDQERVADEFERRVADSLDEQDHEPHELPVWCACCGEVVWHDDLPAVFNHIRSHVATHVDDFEAWEAEVRAS